MPAKHERDKLRQTNVRLSSLGNKLLDTLVEYHGVTKTAVIDMLLRDRARDLGLLVSPEPVAGLELAEEAEVEAE